MDGLNPRQTQIREQLLDVGGDRPVFEAGLADDLRQYVERELVDDVPGDVSERPTVVRKRDLEAVLRCERRWVLESWQGWTVPMARGTVTHRAIEWLMTGGYREDPARAVSAAMDRLGQDEWSLGDFIRSLEEDERVELLSTAVNDVTAFVADWPPVPTKWRPRLEVSRTYEELFGGDVVLRARFDLMLGVPHGLQARSMIVDLKTGRPHDDHLAEARFYALVETLRQGVPPFRVANYYLETGTHTFEDVTEDLLYQAASRLCAGIRRMWQLSADYSDAAVRPSGRCRYCSCRDDCDEGTEFIIGTGLEVEATYQ